MVLLSEWAIASELNNAGLDMKINPGFLYREVAIMGGWGRRGNSVTRSAAQCLLSYMMLHSRTRLGCHDLFLAGDGAQDAGCHSSPGLPFAAAFFHGESLGSVRMGFLVFNVGAASVCGSSS